MSSRSAVSDLLDAWVDGWPFDLAAGESIKFLPSAHDRGFFQVGNGSKDMDVKIYLGSTSAYALFDVGNQSFTLSGIANAGLTSASTGLPIYTFEISGTTRKSRVGKFAANNMHLAENIYYDGSSWLLDDTSNSGVVFSFGGSTLFLLRYAEAGSGARTLINALTMNTSTREFGIGASAAMRPTRFNSLSTRYELKWVAGERGKPGIPADAVDNTTATFAITDPLFEITGTNGTSALCTRDTTGGIVLTTGTTGNDQMILGPHTTSDLSPWKATAWLTNTAVEWECVVKTGADIVNTIIWAGLKLTSDPTVATDDDQIFFRYETTVNGNAFQVIYSIGGSDTTVNTSVAVAASTQYHLKIVIGTDRTAETFINGTLVNTSAALTTNKSLIPFVGIQTKDAAAAALTVRGEAISKAIS